MSMFITISAGRFDFRESSRRLAERIQRLVHGVVPAAELDFIPTGNARMRT